jgi:hypothetical protein
MMIKGNMICYGVDVICCAINTTIRIRAVAIVDSLRL